MLAASVLAMPGAPFILCAPCIGLASQPTAAMSDNEGQELAATTLAASIPSPVITSVSATITDKGPRIVIEGFGFGDGSRYLHRAAYLVIWDMTAHKAAGRQTPFPPALSHGSYRWPNEIRTGVAIDVASWTDNEIVVTGFGGRHESNDWKLSPYDEIKVQVWNAQTGTGPASGLAYVAESFSRVGVSSPTANGPTSPARKLESASHPVYSQEECTGSGDSAVTNSPPGIVRVSSGTGTFSEISPTNKTVKVSPGDTLSGTIRLSVLNKGPAFAIAPLIWTPSWGQHSTAWRLISSWVHPGESVFTAKIDAQAPLQGGTYHILFAFSLEVGGAEIAEFSPRQAADAQSYGCAVDDRLSGKGFVPVYVPADAISVQVSPPLAFPAKSLQ